jgi:UDPglucose 6-dehydrogenase
VDALTRTGVQNGVRLNILESVQDANKTQRAHFFNKIVEHYGEASLKGKTLAMWGLSFKPQTDDIREAPALDIIRFLLDKGARVKVFDPVAMENTGAIFGDSIEYAPGNYECLEGADALIIVTEWNEFRYPDYDKIKELLSDPVIFDGRNLYKPVRMRERGFTYYRIGRQPVSPEK